jgi:SagB-type dehydrogenase family enzyme
VVSTGTSWRNAWKYQARTYRHFGWDNGTILANLLAVAESLDLPARLVCGFVDAEINHLLGLDADREVALSLVSVGRAASPAPPPPDQIPPLHLRTVPLSKREVDYPAMRQMHAASSLSSAEEVAAWRAFSEPLPRRDRQGVEPPLEPIEQVIQRRGSSRRFGQEPISSPELSTILDSASRPIPADFLAPGALLNELYLIVNAVEGMAPGAYYYRAEERALEPLKHGEFRSRAAYLALQQDLAGDAAVAIFFLADLDRCLRRFGNRGYRAVQLEAGILGGRVYLAAYGQHLGATGLTFYDDDVTQFFSPHAAGKSAIFLVAVGHPAPRTR